MIEVGGSTLESSKGFGRPSQRFLQESRENYINFKEYQEILMGFNDNLKSIRKSQLALSNRVVY